MPVDRLSLIERRTKAIARVLYMIDGADFNLIVRERADGPTATLVARKIAEALTEADRGAVKAGWTLQDAIVTELRRSNDEPDPQALWQAVEAWQADAPPRGQ